MLFLYLIVLFSLFGIEKFIKINDVYVVIKIVILVSLTVSSLFVNIYSDILLVFMATYIWVQIYYLCLLNDIW